MLKKIKTLFKAQAKVVVIPLRGIISDAPRNLSRANTSLNFASLRSDIAKAFDDKNTKAVALLINSPGGAPGQAELLYRYIYRLSQEKSIPVYSFVEDVAASGGYWLACAGKEIYALETSILGSIGVFWLWFCQTH